MKRINNANALVRNIRDKQTKEIEGKTPQEMIEYFREKVKELDGKAKKGF